MNLSVRDQISRQEHPAVRFTVNLLKENFSRDLPIDEIATAAGQSPSHLSRLFRQAARHEYCRLPYRYKN